MPTTEDTGTIAWYDRNADLYAETHARGGADADLAAFIALITPERGPILDWGSGPGNTAAILASRGFVADATDASPRMAELAAGMGIRTRLEPFDALAPIPKYQGVWSNFGLQHVPIEHLPDLVGLANAALLPNGVLHLGLTTGRERMGFAEGTWRDDAGVLSTHVAPETAARIVQNAGLILLAQRVGSFRMIVTGEMAFFTIILARKPAEG
ncbi:Methyltransferase domain-containing protein [Palleronia marisminoris]|uniref:Trans-aconitate 2-methyltransferase n=1 Tax=Palleronia marisminoris TaxID=315423 RepID=A0A1Y5TS40_9RHOB|nr:methyltransferase domain-containing protein [Palleronia marisminoris]SFH43612.1 Methyltransferase domain-containing protein [Palleronia marisminoris]SLN66705.1 Trans-aconitate 2-methyltransferase [Palleronia marisminoris]